jgi:hypothetical protein
MTWFVEPSASSSTASRRGIELDGEADAFPTIGLLSSSRQVFSEIRQCVGKPCGVTQDRFCSEATVTAARPGASTSSAT